MRGIKIHYFEEATAEGDPRRALCGTPNYKAAFRNQGKSKAEKLATISCLRCRRMLERA